MKSGETCTTHAQRASIGKFAVKGKLRHFESHGLSTSAHTYLFCLFIYLFIDSLQYIDATNPFKGVASCTYACISSQCNLTLPTPLITPSHPDVLTRYTFSRATPHFFRPVCNEKTRRMTLRLRLYHALLPRTTLLSRRRGSCISGLRMHSLPGGGRLRNTCR